MRIQHNIMAMSAYRNYTNNVAAMKKNLEKLSSGYKINRAGDDAAGLAISEKMRAQITGLQTAQKNAKDGISLVQTAEGALTEVHDMLNRMVELATMSANGTYDKDTDRQQLQKEVTQLQDEINRIADSANFNGIKLLNGDMDASLKMGALTDVAVSAVADGAQSGPTAGTAGKYVIDLSDLKLTGKASTASASAVNASLTAFTVGGQKFKDASGADISFTASSMGKVNITGTDLATKLNGSKITLDGITYDVAGANGKLTLTSSAVPNSTTAIDNTTFDVVLTAGASTTHNNGFDQSVHMEAKAVADEGSKLAQGSFTLTTTHVTDGTALQIGKNTYVFKVGKDSTVEAATGQTLIDLSKSTNTGSDLVKEAAMLLSQKSNDQFHMTVNNDGTTIHLTEKAGTVTYAKDYDLAGTASSDTNATWKRVADGKSVVQFSAMTKVNANGKALTLQIGDTADDYNKLKVNIQDMHAKTLGIGDGQISILTQDEAALAIDKIKAAINTVSDVRGTLGATQNRLDHTINNLSVMTENIQDAESTIRDTDVAEEMMAYTKNNILIQSAQAMLAQANQVPQGVLQLLQ